MKIIRASEIGTYVFCQRAWWYQLMGYEPDNQLELAAGIETHEQHSRLVARSSMLQLLAIALLMGAIVLGVLWYVQLH